MPTVNGYHLFGLPLAVKELDSGISFSELENELGGGYYAQVLFGSENGERFWRLTLPTLTGSSMDGRTVEGINNDTLTYEEYIWDLFCEQKVTGTAFAYQDTRSGQYYLARFANKELTYSRMLTKLYSTGLELKQWRISGKTVFEPTKITQLWGAWNPADFPDFEGVWPAHLSSVLSTPPAALSPSGDVISTTSGTLPIVRLSSTTDNGKFTSGNNVTIKEAYLLMKIREATFGADDGIITGAATPNNAFLVGKSGTNEFYNFGFTGTHTHELDGVAYTQATARAPMNAWGIVHVRNTAGVAITSLQIGADRNFAGRFAELDLAYVLIADELIPKSKQREIMEFLSILKAKLV